MNDFTLNLSGMDELKAIFTSSDEKFQEEVYSALEEDPEAIVSIEALAYDDEYAQELEALSLKFI